MRWGVTRSAIAAVAVLALAACQSAREPEEGERTNWRCAGDAEFSLRRVSNGVEVFAAGQTHRLDPVAGGQGQYSNGAVTYTESGGGATLTGVHGGPFENCRRQRGDWWFDFW
jgi:hypothetical protein